MKSPILMAALLAVLTAASPAAAQLAKNSKAPVDVTADQLETHNADCVYVYTGSAEALQDTARLRADVLTAHLEIKKGKAGASATSGAAGSCGEMLSLEAKGRVYYVSTDGRRVHGDNAVYTASTKTIVITGDVTAVDGQNVMRGTRMVYNIDTGDGHVEGGGKGPTAKNRPRGVFYPKDSGAEATPAAVTKDATPRKSAK
jgi:lipopolysaccharide export system protein LptA